MGAVPRGTTDTVRHHTDWRRRGSAPGAKKAHSPMGRSRHERHRGDARVRQFTRL